MDPAIDKAFQFLVDRHAFRQADRDGSVAYQSKVLTVIPSFNERDGFETHLEFPGYGASRVAVGTILAALGEASTGGLAMHVAFLESMLGKLTNAPPAIYDDLTALRFWHAPQWRQDWGKSITLDDGSIVAEKTRLLRLQRYFSNTSNPEPNHDANQAVV